MNVIGDLKAIEKLISRLVTADSSGALSDSDLERCIALSQTFLEKLTDERDLRAVFRATQGCRPPAHHRTRLEHETGTQMYKRDALVLALESIGFASPVRRAAAVMQSSFRLTISTSQFAVFRKADERSFRRAPRYRVYLVPALSTADFTPISGIIALSSWPSEKRLLGKHSLRLDSLRAILNASARYRLSNERHYIELVRIIGRELKFVPTNAADIEHSARATYVELADHASRDYKERQDAAMRLASSEPSVRMYGNRALSA